MKFALLLFMTACDSPVSLYVCADAAVEAVCHGSPSNAVVTDTEDHAAGCLYEDDEEECTCAPDGGVLGADESHGWACQF